MSRPPLRRLVAPSLVAALAMACADPAAGPTASTSAAPGASRGAADLAAAPVSPGWHARARALVGEARMSPLAAARVYAALGVAQYRAVAGADRHVEADGTLPESGIGAGGRAQLEARRGAVAGASAELLAFFFPAARASLEQHVADEAAAGPGGVHPHFARGLAIGRDAGQALADRAAGDHFTVPWTGTVPTGPGMWRAAPNAAPVGGTFGGVTPYLLATSSQFRPAPPPAFDSPAFAADLAEVLALAIGRTPEQRGEALYWNFGTGTFTPPGYWNLVAGSYVQAGALDERAATHVFALSGAAAMDALIACWEAKYHYWTMRPSQADAAITLSLGLPNHPSYPSGHSCVSAASASVLTYFFPDRAGELAGWLDAAGMSRMHAGIHFRFDVSAGKALGRSVAAWAIGRDESVGLLTAMRWTDE